MRKARQVPAKLAESNISFEIDTVTLTCENLCKSKAVIVVLHIAGNLS